MINITHLTQQQFKALPLVIEGESKEVRYVGDGLVVIKLKPTIYSYTHNRTGRIGGSDTLRLKAIQKILPILKAHNIHHSYREVNDDWILSQLVLQPCQNDQELPFRPNDMSASDIAQLPVAPPIEVIAKYRHTGTSKHRYYAMDTYPTRFNDTIQPDRPYPETLIRFDWRNPMHHPQTRDRLADEVLSEQMADWYIDTCAARKLAAKTFAVLGQYFQASGLDLWDICFFISQDGSTLFGEISPDCMRVRTTDNSPMDKDIWRAGGSSKEIVTKWQTMIQMLQ